MHPQNHHYQFFLKTITYLEFFFLEKENVPDYQNHFAPLRIYTIDFNITTYIGNSAIFHIKISEAGV